MRFWNRHRSLTVLDGSGSRVSAVSVVGNQDPRVVEGFGAEWDIDLRLHQWSTDSLADVARHCDVAVVPVDMSDPMAIGKPENRMRIFWRLGIPVVASASPANIRAASSAGLSDRILCSTTSDWERILGELHACPDDRLEIARLGQAAALTAYSEESLAARWDRLFESL